MFSTDGEARASMNDLVILGDKSRETLLEWLMKDEETIADKNGLIRVRHGNKVSVDRSIEDYSIESPLLLPKMTLIIPPYSKQDLFIDSDEYSKYVVIEEFPFRKQANIEPVQKLENAGKQVTVVLMDTPRHQASTDLTIPGDDLRQAVDAYRKEHVNVAVIKSPEDLPRFLHIRQTIYDLCVKKIRGYIDDLREKKFDIKIDYEVDVVPRWKEDGGLLEMQTIDRLFSYETCNREREDNLWDRCVSALRKALFPPGTFGPLTPAVDLYKKWLDSPAVFWSKDDDANDFTESLKNRFFEKLEETETLNRYRDSTRFYNGFNKDIYLNMMAKSQGNETALNAILSGILADYLNVGVLEQLEARAERRINQLEEIINEK